MFDNWLVLKIIFMSVSKVNFILIFQANVAGGIKVEVPPPPPITQKITPLTLPTLNKIPRGLFL